MTAEQREIVFQLLRLRSSRSGDTHVLSAQGELDLSSSQALARELEAADDSDAERILLDLSELTFIDCSALRVILGMDARQRGRSGRFVVRTGPPNVHRVLAITSAARQLGLS